VVQAGQHQFRHRGLRRHLDHFRRQVGPDRVQVGEPVEQFAILRGRNRPRQALIHVVVGIDQAGQHDVMAGVYDFIGGLRQRSAGADLFDHVVADKDRAVADFLRAARSW